MGKFFYGDEDEYDDISERSVSGKGPSDANTEKKPISIKDSDTIKDKEKYINSKLIEFGFYKGEENAELKDNSSKDLIKINGEFFIKKKELSKEDEMFLKLRALDILRESQKNTEEQKESLKIIKYILVFFTALILISVIISIFIGIKSVKTLKYLYLYPCPYEQRIEGEKYL